MKFKTRRLQGPLTKLTGRSWEDVSPKLEEWLAKLNRIIVEGIPAGFNAITASVIGIVSSAGTEGSGWAAADHTHDGRHTLLDGRLHTDSSIDPPAKGAIIAGSATLWDLLPPSSDDLVLTLDAAQALGLKWAAPGSSILSPPQIVANQNNYNPGGGDIWRLSSDASRNITGIAAGVSGKRLRIANVGAFDIVLKHQDGLSTVANRLLGQGFADITLTPEFQADLWYDPTTTRWRMVAL